MEIRTKHLGSQGKVESLKAIKIGAKYDRKKKQRKKWAAPLWKLEQNN